MKLYAVTLSLLLALPFAAQADTKEAKAWINGRPVVVRTATSTQAPVACQEAFDRQVEQHGWHDQIYRSAANDGAVVIYSQREGEPYRLKEVKVTLWKAATREGKTLTETWVYSLRPDEVNRFLDDELPQVAVQFTNRPVQS